VGQESQTGILETARSRPGRVVAWERYGEGPGIVVLPGAARAARHYRTLAEALSRRFTVHLVDRDGRGVGLPPQPGAALEAEIDDVAAVFEATGARFLFGHSAGGMIALETVRRVPVERLALYEPAISIDGSFSVSLAERFRQALARNDFARAQVGLAKTVGAIPWWIPNMPLRWLFRRLMAGPAGAQLRELLRAAMVDFDIAIEMDGPAARFADIEAPTLVMWGARSPAFLTDAAAALARALPQGRGERIARQGHNAPDLTAPKRIAGELAAFFG
jgi:pimeloyl-ACP methyl ester carboxylesterase